MKQNSNKGSEFWIDYCEAVVESGIQGKTAEWLQPKAQKFAIAIKGKPLRSGSSEDVYSFFDKVYVPAVKKIC